MDFKNNDSSAINFQVAVDDAYDTSSGAIHEAMANVSIPAGQTASVLFPSSFPGAVNKNLNLNPGLQTWLGDNFKTMSFISFVSFFVIFAYFFKTCLDGFEVDPAAHSE